MSGITMDDPVAPPDQYGCLAMAVATALAALLLTLGLPMAGSLASYVSIYVSIFVFTTVVVTIIGMPLFLLALRFRQANAPIAVVAGAVTGAAFPAIGALSYATTDAWLISAGYALAGAVGGVTFFLVGTAPRAPRRNLTAITALAAISISVALLIQPHRPRPEDSRTVAAFEIPLPTAVERQSFLQILRVEAQAKGFHLDAASEEELRSLSEVSPITMNACIWRGDDAEIVACAMDAYDNPGRIWITFPRGEDPRLFAEFRTKLMRRIARRWPQAMSLPIMPTGAIPLTRDLVRTPSGYEVAPAARSRYGLKAPAAR